MKKHLRLLFYRYLPATCSWLVFLFFFSAFFILTPNSANYSRGITATASLLRFDVVRDTISLAPSQSGFQSVFPAKLVFEPTYSPAPLLGQSVAAQLHDRFHALSSVFDHIIDPAWLPLLDRLELDGFHRTPLREIFSALGPQSYSPAFMAAKVTELFGIGGTKASPLFPAERFIPEGYTRPLPKVTAKNCLQFMALHEQAFAHAEKTYGVPANIIMGILLIETELGTNLGKDSALRALAGMAATHSPEMLASKGATRQTASISRANLTRVLQSKSEWAYRELVALLHYGLDGGVSKISDLATLPGSVYGAIGLCQFMPSNISPYGVDADNDGAVNLFTPTDALASVANYLSKHGWRQSLDTAGRIGVLLTYNRDFSYANNVLAVAEQIRLCASGKAAADSNPMRVVSRSGNGYLDPSLRGRRSFGRLKPLDSYSSLLQ